MECRDRSALVGAIGLLLFIAACGPSQAITSDQAVALLKKTGLFGSDATFNAQATADEVVVTAYVYPRSTDIDTDCKIDTVMMAKEFMAADSGITNVTGIFYNPRTRELSRQVTVTLGAVKAFESGQINREQLLASLVVSRGAPTNMTPNSGSATSNRQIAGSVSSPETSSARDSASPQSDRSSKDGDAGTSQTAKAVPTEDTQGSNEPTEDKKTSVAQALPKTAAPSYSTYAAHGLTLTYPTNWKVIESRRDETVVTFENVATDSSIDFKIFRNGPQGRVGTVQELHQIHVNQHLSRSGAALQHAPPQVRFGIGNSIAGLNEVVTYTTKHGSRVYERNVSFGWPGLVYRLRLRCNASDYDNASKIFDKVLSSASFGSVTTSTSR